MEPRCSCPASRSFMSLKQHPLCIYGNRKVSKTYLFFNNINKNLSTFSYDDLKLVENVSKTYGDEIDEGVSMDAEKPTESRSVASCDGSLIDRPETPLPVETGSRKTLKKSVAELSAQIMNVPFQDFGSSLSRQDADSRSNVSKLSCFDVFEKIKDVYKACSCKVCACIVGKPQQNEICKCMLCECDVCNKFKKNIRNANTLRSVDVAQAEPYSLKLKMGMHNKFAKDEFNKESNSRPYEYAKSAFPLYDCKQCHFVECKASCYNHNKYQKLVFGATETNNRNRQEGMTCNCAQCRQCHGISSNLRYEICSEINRPLRCHCDICLNEDNLPEHTSTCSSERRHRLIKQHMLRDSDYLNEQNQHVDKNQVIAMVAALSKIYQNYHTYEKQCSYRQCNCLHCNNKEHIANVVKTSNGISDNDRIKYRTMKAFSLGRNYVTRKSYFRITKSPRWLKNLKRHPEIKTINKFSSSSKCCRCRCSLRQCSDCDLIMSTSTGDVCDCADCKRYKRYICKNEIIYPDKKREKKRAANFENKVNRSLYLICDERNENDDDYETPQKKARSSLLGEYHKTILPTYDHFNVFDEKSHIQFPNVEQQLYQKLSTKLKSRHHVEPMKMRNCSNITKAINVYRAVNEYPMPNHINNGSTPQPENKYQSNRLDHSDVSATVHCSPTFSRLDKELFDVHATSLRFAKDNDRDPNKLRDKCCFAENDYLLSTNEYSQCNTINSSDTLDLNQNKILMSRMKEDCECAVNCSKNREEFHKVSNELIENIQNISIRNDFNLKEDNRKVYNTIQEARTFSIHLKEMLDTYEKANRDFESVYNNLTHTRNALQDVVSISQDILREVKEILNYNENVTTENYSDNASTKYSFDSVPTKEPNANTLFLDSNHNQNIKNKLTIQVKSNSSILTNDLSTINNSRHSSNNINTENFENMNELAHFKPYQSNLSSSFCSSFNNDVIFKFERQPSNIFSFNYSNMADDSSNCESEQYPMYDTNAPSSAQLHHLVKRRNIKKQPKRCPKNESNRRKLYVPTFSKCSVTTETSNDLVDQINENYSNLNDIRTGQSKPLVEGFESVVDESASLETDDSATTINTTEIINKLEVLSRMRYQGKAEPSDVFMHKPPSEIEIFTCESLKVSALTVQKASDHTILAKWQVPRVLENVEGYELLVNGRSVHKVEDNLCCESVVSDLPREEKILLTVRTMTKSSCSSGYSPTTTVVYTPVPSKINTSKWQ